MAVVVGTNSGFVTSRPTADPAGNSAGISAKCWSSHDTTHSTAAKVTEMGIYINSATVAADIDLGIYTDNGSDQPGTILAGKITIAKGTTAGWKFGACDITVSGSTKYWVAAQCDTSSGTNFDYGSGTKAIDDTTSTTQLPSTYTVSSTNDGLSIACYAIWEVAATGTDMQINIGDTWKAVPLMKINIADDWKAVEGAQINIGDAWKEIF